MGAAHPGLTAVCEEATNGIEGQGRKEREEGRVDDPKGEGPGQEGEESRAEGSERTLLEPRSTLGRGEAKPHPRGAEIFIRAILTWPDPARQENQRIAPRSSPDRSRSNIRAPVQCH